MRNSTYHKTLRICAAIVTLVLVFDSGLLSPITKQLSNQTQLHLASVIGVGAAVEPTELNLMTAELTKQKAALDKRESALREREITVNVARTKEGSNSNQVSTYLISVLLFIILVLMVLNYVLDFTRERHLRNLATLKHNS